MTGWRGLLAGRRPGRSAERDAGDYERKPEDDAVDGPHELERMMHLRSDEAEKESGEAEEGPDQGDTENGAKHGEFIGDFGWETMHGGHSLVLSAIAAIVLVGANLVEPEHMQAWQVLGGLAGYFIGVPVCFALDRRLHRKRRAVPVPDRSGGGRQALILMAVAFCLLGGEETAGLAGWTAFSALVLGGLTDGAWLSLVAGQRGVGLWGALRALQASAPTAQERYWTALFGRDGR